ncbi:MAG: DUF3429 domain-containing protein, partial [Pseudomonadota bacterium]
MSARSIMYSLGLAGLIPFLVPVILIASGSSYGPYAGWIANAYALGIICFLTGSWWGMGLAPENRWLLVMSNVIFLLAIAAFLFMQAWWSMAAALLLGLLFLGELNGSLFENMTRQYRSLRAALTLIATFC